MAARLHSAGYEVYGNVREREHALALEEAGLRWRDTPREVAEAAEIVLTTAQDDALESAASGPTESSPGSPPARSGWTSVPSARA